MPDLDPAKPDPDPQPVSNNLLPDITNGRYDNPTFPLFRTLFSKHAGDFYQNCTMGTTAMSGPRQPWHDIHARVEGPIVRDVLANFADRWIKQNPAQCEDLLDLDEEPGLVVEAAAPEQEGDGGPWVVQLLRSISIDSAVIDVVTRNTNTSVVHLFIYPPPRTGPRRSGCSASTAG